MAVIQSKTAQSRFSGSRNRPQLAAPYEIIDLSGQSLGAGAIGTVLEKNAANSLDRNGVGMLEGMMRADGQPVYVNGPMVADYNYTTPATRIGAAFASGNIATCLYVAAALRIRRAAAGLPNPTLLTTFNGIPGQSINEFDDDPATGSLGLQIHKMRGYWLSEARRLAGSPTMRHVGLAQGEADSNMAAGLYYARAIAVWSTWLSQIEAIMGARPRPYATQIGAYADSVANKSYHVCTEQIRAVLDVGGWVPGPWYPIQIGDNNVHPNDRGYRLMGDLIAWGIVELESGRDWPALIPTTTREGGDLVLTYPCRPDETMVLHDPARYAAYGGFCANAGFEAGAISSVVAGGRSVRLTTTSNNWAYAYQFQNVTGGEAGGLNYGAHRGLVRSSLSTPSVLVPGETLNRWALSWRGAL